MTPATEDRNWLPAGAFAFVILALLGLAITPGLIFDRAASTWEIVSRRVLPAYDALREVAFAMEERTSASRARFLTEDPRYTVALRQAEAVEAAAVDALDTLVVAIIPGAAAHIDSIRVYAARRDSLVAVVARTGPELQEYQASLPHFDRLQDSMQVQLAQLRTELAAATDQWLEENARAARLQRTLSIVLGVIAVFAAGVVGWFAWTQRRLRREVQAALEDATRQRTIAERREEELRVAAELRSRLLRGITHDVKNPLSAAKGYAELLAMGIKAPLHPAQKPFVDGVTRSVDGALAIIGDLLDLARADSNGLSVERVQVDLRQVARDAAEDHRSAAEAAGLEMTTSFPDEPLRIFTDPARVDQVLGNLLTNAIKYTPPPGRIIVSAVAVDDDEAPDGIRGYVVQVDDTGPGIPEKDRGAIFDEFTRLDDDSPQKGHGLGLAIARRVARLLGGELTAEAADTGGARFALWLPVRETGSADAAPTE